LAIIADENVTRGLNDKDSVGKNFENLSGEI